MMQIAEWCIGLSFYQSNNKKNMMAEKFEFKVETVETPCISKCCLDEEDICLGCHRTLEEITSWLTVDDETRERYMKNIEKRKVEREARKKF